MINGRTFASNKVARANERVSGDRVMLKTAGEAGEAGEAGDVGRRRRSPRAQAN